jgi:hypothetical protein
MLAAAPGVKYRAALSVAWGGSAGVRSRCAEGERYRQRADDDPDRAEQAPQGSLRNAVAVAREPQGSSTEGGSTVISPAGRSFRLLLRSPRPLARFRPGRPAGYRPSALAHGRPRSGGAEGLSRTGHCLGRMRGPLAAGPCGAGAVAVTARVQIRWPDSQVAGLSALADRPGGNSRAAGLKNRARLVQIRTTRWSFRDLSRRAVPSQPVLRLRRPLARF